MSNSKRKTISEYLADRIIRNQMRVKFSHAHADFLQERANEMSTPTSSTLNGGSTMIPEQTSDANKASEGQRPLAKDATGNVYTVGSQVNVGPIKYVDAKEFDGDRGGDTRAKAAPAVLPNQPNPREQMGQFPLSGRTPAASAPITTIDETEVGG